MTVAAALAASFHVQLRLSRGRQPGPSSSRDTSAGSPTRSWSWNFGDRLVQHQLQNPSHVPTHDGRSPDGQL
ncbi:MAG: hypothetical protein MZU79_06960 [Anaerotruncus sp.]|nr:hypothetical protein [Anaerotruncus sp.]